jgi:pimeloyl-ACP methyl ester carboxylesterase
MTATARRENSTTVRATSGPLRAPASTLAFRAGLKIVAPHAPSLASMWAERLFLTARRHRRPAWEAEALSGASFARVPHGSSRLPTWSWGAANLPAVILVHGWEGRGSQLAAFVEPLLRAELRVVTFDAPGHGDAPRSPASVVEHARALVSVAESVGPVHAVIGHSVGGAASLLATRFGFRASRFALVAPPVGPRRFAEGFARMLELPPAVRDGMLARLERRYGISMAELDARVDAGRLDAPLLVVHDADDTVVPFRDGASIAGAARAAEIVETEGLGHRRVLRSPHVVDAVTRFVTAGIPEPPSFAETLESDLFYRDRRYA